jgi:hypothetical protein
MKVIKIKPQILTVKLDGGLGNQMFQYAFIKSLAARHGEHYQLDASSYIDSEKRGKLGLNKLEVPEVFVLKKSLLTDLLFLRLLRKLKIGQVGNIFIETGTQYCAAAITSTCSYFYGYFQSFKYFDHLRRNLQAEFKFVKGRQSRYYERITHAESVGIHVRKGDYLSNRRVFDLMVQLDKDYYLAAAKRLAAVITQPLHFFLFSNDPDWVKNNLVVELQKVGTCTLVQHQMEEADLYDFECLKNCRHQVISNSSFSWWAAYLNDYDKKNVIAPKQWYKNEVLNYDTFYPAEWLIQ